MKIARFCIFEGVQFVVSADNSFGFSVEVMRKMHL